MIRPDQLFPKFQMNRIVFSRKSLPSTHLLGNVEDGGDDVCLEVVEVRHQPGTPRVPGARVTSEMSRCGIRPGKSDIRDV